MDDNDVRHRPRGGRHSDMLLGVASRAAAASRAATSPSAVEATLASISDEVMEEAIARRDRAAGSTSPKQTGRS
jgi:hypothetical protein